MADVSSAEAFAELVGERFAVTTAPMANLPAASEQPTELELTEVSGRDPGFALTFRGPATPRLPQATYRFARPGEAPRDIFIVPVAGDGEKTLYEAIFT